MATEQNLDMKTIFLRMSERWESEERLRLLETPYQSLIATANLRPWGETAFLLRDLALVLNFSDDKLTGDLVTCIPPQFRNRILAKASETNKDNSISRDSDYPKCGLLKMAMTQVEDEDSFSPFAKLMTTIPQAGVSFIDFPREQTP